MDIVTRTENRELLALCDKIGTVDFAHDAIDAFFGHLELMLGDTVAVETEDAVGRRVRHDACRFFEDFHEWRIDFPIAGCAVEGKRSRLYGRERDLFLFGRLDDVIEDGLLERVDAAADGCRRYGVDRDDVVVVVEGFLQVFLDGDAETVI